MLNPCCRTSQWQDRGDPVQDGLIFTIIYSDGHDGQSFTCYGPETQKVTEGSSSYMIDAFATRGF